ncbi:hypothetical protein M3Y95_00548100 [Aphelenchoides besseyi]|nr:hypothetical protein M3Y95_00548100 [Aphelenchoides besseyi]
MFKLNSVMHEHNYLGNATPFFGSFSKYTPDGRFLIDHSDLHFKTLDLFHSKKRKLYLDVSSATIDNTPLTRDNSYHIESVFACLNATIVIFCERYNSSNIYLGLGKISLKRLSLVVKQTLTLSSEHRAYNYKWLPTCYPPNLYDGLILEVANWRSPYFMIKMEDDNQLRLTPLKVPIKMDPFGCFDGFLCGLAESQTNHNNDVNQQTSIDLIKYSISNDTHTREKTNSDIMDENMVHHSKYTELKCCVGRMLFMYLRCDDKNHILSLDINTLKWSTINLPLKTVRSMGSDGLRVLIFSTYGSTYGNSIYRYVFNEPDKLYDLAWLQLKRIFDAQPSAYEAILSKLPATFKSKCLLREP